jgi:hypothetical protein
LMALGRKRRIAALTGEDLSLGERVMVVADLYENRKSAAQSAGISIDQLFGYIRGENEPRLTRMAALVGPVGVNLEWLATGRGPMRKEVSPPGALDLDLIKAALVAVEEVLAELGRSPPPQRKAELLLAVYQADISARAEGRPGIGGAELIRLVRARS